jgi:hypothetical protein
MLPRRPLPPLSVSLRPELREREWSRLPLSQQLVASPNTAVPCLGTDPAGRVSTPADPSILRRGSRVRWGLTPGQWTPRQAARAAHMSVMAGMMASSDGMVELKRLKPRSMYFTACIRPSSVGSVLVSRLPLSPLRAHRENAPNHQLSMEVGHTVRSSRKPRMMLIYVRGVWATYSPVSSDRRPNSDGSVPIRWFRYRCLKSTHPRVPSAGGGVVCAIGFN